jgi:hypothetical protein
MADAPEEAATAALGRLRPEPLAPLATPVTVTGQRWGQARRSYVHTAADRAVPLDSHLEMVSAVGGVAVTRRLATSHMPMLSGPAGLAAALLDLTA